MTKRCFKCNDIFIQQDSIREGIHTVCFNEWFHVNSKDTFEDVVARAHETTSDNWVRIVSSFFHGKFRKYSARLGSTSYILKVQQDEFPELPAMEYLCNQIARNLGLWVPNHYLIQFQNELETFVCENFMQNHPGCDLIHIYRFLESPEQFSCVGLLNVLEKNVKRYDDIQRFIELCLFDALIGNHDRHGRNLALIQSDTELRLAPFYDNPSYIALEHPSLLGAQLEPRGAIATKNTLEPTMRDYVNEWSRLNFYNVIKEFKEKINIPKINDLVSHSFISPKRKQAFIRLIHKRYEELCEATNGQ